MEPGNKKIQETLFQWTIAILDGMIRNMKSWHHLRVIEEETVLSGQYLVTT